MPWKKNFDEGEVLERAMKVFWEKGYEATSIRDLMEATGVKRQSLYNTFGGKREFFIRTLLKYDTERRQNALAAYEARGTPLDSIKAIFDQAVGDPLSRGCFLVNTALELQRHDEEIKMLVSAAVEDFRGFYERLIEHGKVQGEIPPTVDASTAAAGLLAALFGLRSMGRGAATEEMLRQAAAQAMKLLA